MPFRNPLALSALALIIPLIIFYLFSRKPKKKVFSSLMFFIKENTIKQRSAFFRRLMANSLFFLQLLAILLLAFATATPLLNISQERSEEHITIILDSSASMQAKYKSTTRFDASVKEAKNLIKDKDKISIILAEQIPLTLLEKGSSEKAANILNNIQPSDTLSNIDDALLQASSLMQGGTVYVLSDFASIPEPLIAKRQLNAKNVRVVFKEFNEPVNNIGIVDLEVTDQVRLKIKNYNSQNVKFNVKSSTESKEVILRANGVETIYFDIQAGSNTFELEVNDDFPVDNFVYVSIPEVKRIPTLYITNNQGKDYLKTALESLNKLEITTTNLPVLPGGDYKLYIIKDIDKSKILPSTFHDIEKNKDAGIIIHLQPDSHLIDYKKLSLLSLFAPLENSQPIKLIQNSVTSDVEFSKAYKYFSTSDEECDKWVVTETNNTLLCVKDKIITFGVLEQHSDFKNTPDFPLFWSYLIDYLVPEEEEYKLQFQTGEIIPTSFQKVSTPVGELKTNRVIMNKIGFYSFDNKSVASNLLSFEESNLNMVVDINQDSLLAGNTAVGLSKQKDISKTIIWIAFFLVIIELIFIKWRGDL